MVQVSEGKARIPGLQSAARAAAGPCAPPGAHITLLELGGGALATAGALGSHASWSMTAAAALAATAGGAGPRTLGLQHRRGGQEPQQAAAPSPHRPLPPFLPPLGLAPARALTCGCCAACLQGGYKYHQYQVVGRHVPTEKEPEPTIYRMKLWATDAVRAKSKFWCAFEQQGGFTCWAAFAAGCWMLQRVQQNSRQQTEAVS